MTMGMRANVTVRGQIELERHLSKMADVDKLFDGEIAKTARGSVRRLVTGTNKKTGTTARGWTKVRKLGPSKYEVANDITTEGSKIPLVTILNDGRRSVTPKKAKRLYIPLSEKGRSKKPGAKIPKSFVYGVDYIFKDRVRKFRGTRFLDREIQRATNEQIKNMLGRIRRT